MMSNISFENYGARAENLNCYTAIAGRHSFQKEEERRILVDIIKKLDIQPNDDCLEIGCGVGNLLIPLSFFCNHITGIDHTACIDRLKERFDDSNNIELIDCNFFNYSTDKKFDKIIIYSVLHYMKDQEEFLNFVFKAMDFLKPKGKLLLGDIPNESKKQRFSKTEFGIQFQQEWNERINNNKQDKTKEMLTNLSEDKDLVVLDDDFILEVLKKIRAKGCEAYLLPQLEGLPFCYTREDILIEKR